MSHDERGRRRLRLRFKAARPGAGPASPPRASDHTLPAGRARSQYETGASPAPIVSLRRGRRGLREATDHCRSEEAELAAGNEAGDPGIARGIGRDGRARIGELARARNRRSWPTAPSRPRSGSPSWPRGPGHETGTSRPTTSRCRSRPTWTASRPSCGPPDRCWRRPRTSSAPSRSASSCATERHRAPPRHRGLPPRGPPGPRLAGARLQLRRAARGHQRHRHRARGRRAGAVFGHEHYVEHLEDLACAGVPIRHPVTHKVLGVIDLTCWRRDAGMMMVAAAAARADASRRCCWSSPDAASTRCCTTTSPPAAGIATPPCWPSATTCSCSTTGPASCSPSDQGPLLAEATEALATADASSCWWTCRAD